MAVYCVVAFTDTLMRWDNDLGIHLQAGDRPSTFYFRVPDTYATLPDAKLQELVANVSRHMYDDLNAGFRQAEPSDLSYMLCKSTIASVLDAAGVAAKPWMTAPNPAVWEPTVCVVAHEDATYGKVAREAF